MPYTVRLATPADLSTLVRHRHAMLRDMGERDEVLLDAMDARFAPWALRRMAAGDYFHWLTEKDGAIAAGAAVWLRDRHPGTRRSNERVVYVLNVYCEPVHRRQGLARRLLETILDWARSEGYDTVELHASDEGRPLYASLGFAATNEMRLPL